MKQAPLLQLLSAHQPFDSHEQEMLERIVAFVREFTTYACGVIFVSHHTTLMYPDDRCLVMNAGRIVMDDVVSGVLQNISSDLKGLFDMKDDHEHKKDD